MIPHNDITIVTVFKSGPRWLPEYVYRLRDMLTRYLRVPFEFVCVSDVELPGIATLPLHAYDDAQHMENIWYKVQMFRPDLALTGPCLYLDLDMIIKSDFSDVIYQCRGHSFLMSNDPWKGNISCSAIMYWEGDHSDIWTKFCRDPAGWARQYQSAADRRQRGAEQAFVADTKSHELIQNIIDSTLRTDRVRKTTSYTESASILFCSGRRKPWLMPHHPDVRCFWLGEPMIIDTTMFNNEFDMLDIRLALTEGYVDHWIICEGNRTLSGHPKPYYLTENLDRYHRYRDRMTVIQCDVPETWTNWDVDNGQRAAIQNGYHLMAAADDIIIHSDLDEILNPNLIGDIVNMLDTEDKPVSCNLDMYIFKFDRKVERNWRGPVVARRRHFTDPCELYKGLGSGVGRAHKRKNRDHCVAFPAQAGWHWGWMGDEQRIKTKVVSCIESQNRDPDLVLQQLIEGDTGAAINHKCRTVFDAEPGYPVQVLDVIKKYPWWSQTNE